MITIFTPTYNRANIIHRTYESLCLQVFKDFEWLVVDDGSTDKTEELILQWQHEATFPIRYIKTKNGGKYRAYNVGLQNARGDLFFCVDSDDWLTIDSLNLIYQHYDYLMSNSNIAGITALKEYSDHQIIGNPYTCDCRLSSLYNLETIGQGGERSLIFKTAIAQQYLFPEETYEKFMGECVVYDRMNEYSFIVSNDVLTTCEYQQSGLSSNPRDLMLRNPSGYKLYYSQRIDLATNLKDRFVYALRYHAFRAMCLHNHYNYCGSHSLLVSFTSIFTPIMLWYYKR